MKNYLELENKILVVGKKSTDRTGTGTTRIFAPNRDLRFDLSKRFPAPSTKKLAEQAMFGEFCWMVNAGTTIGELKHYTFNDEFSEKRTIWCGNYEKQGALQGYRYGYLGPVYGFNWRNFGYIEEVRPGVDQLQNVIDRIKSDPTGRRHVVYTVDPATVDACVLPPCHDFFQFFVEDGKLSLDFHMRSVDVFLGLPFNIGFYATMCHVVANICDLEVGELTCMLGDTHIYADHYDAVCEQLARAPANENTQLIFPDIKSLDDLADVTAKDFKLINYNPQPAIKAPMSA